MTATVFTPFSFRLEYLLCPKTVPLISAADYKQEHLHQPVNPPAEQGDNTTMKDYIKDRLFANQIVKSMSINLGECDVDSLVVL